MLKENVLMFASEVSSILRDMGGPDLPVSEGSERESRFSPAGGMVAMIHFTGAIQGDYAVAMSEKVAARLAGLSAEGTGPEGAAASREDYGGFMKEVLNAAVGQAIPSLEREFDALTFLSPVVVYGDLDYPDVPAGRVVLSGPAGEVECFLALNLVGIELGERLQGALKALGESVREANGAKRGIRSILDAFPAGLVTVDRSGRIRPGHARLTSKSVGLEDGAEIPGMHVVDLLGFDAALRDPVERWLELVYDRWGEIPFGDMLGLCPLKETENVRKVVVRPVWAPLPGEDGAIDGLLLLAEDVTEKRRAQEEIGKLSRLHEEGLEQMTRIVNLEPDEIQDFVYDSSGLLREAGRIVQGAHRDRRFIETLYRAVHALKGQSGRFEFNGLRKLALGIEEEISRLGGRMEWDDDRAGSEGVERIREGIREAEGYVRRLEELRGKLGPRDEDLVEKAGRAVPSVMVPLAEIESVAATIWGAHQTGSCLGWPTSVMGLLAAAAAAAASLREVEFSRLSWTLQSVVDAASARSGKVAVLSLVGNGPLDIEVQRLLHRCLVHLVDNAMDHGIELPSVRFGHGKLETGVLRLEYVRRDDRVEISLSDDGAGVDLESLRAKAVEKAFMDPEEAGSASSQDLLDLLFRSGFTTRPEAGATSGRGVGLDMVRDSVQSLGGSIRMESEKGVGTTLRIRIPLAIAVPSTRFAADNRN